jgi:AbrB family looped-hinge helix DNA binding protein
MTGRVGAKGQVVIPKSIRDQINLHPGDEVEFELRDEEIVLVARRQHSVLGWTVRAQQHGGTSARGPWPRATMRVCLDSWAILAWLDGEEPALSRVNELTDAPGRQLGEPRGGLLPR